MITDDIAVNFQPVLFLVCLWMKWERLLSQEQLIKKVNLFFSTFSSMLIVYKVLYVYNVITCY